ncbi:MAG: phage major capsid protein [Betaproteobacteria bacterium]
MPEKINRAYSVLTIKSYDDDKRMIEGIATTPSPDRYGDIVEPDGAKFQLPIPLLWQHDSDKPVGHVTFAKIGKEGIAIKASLVKITEPGALKNRLDEAWQSLKSGLVRGLSIGFTPLESEQIKHTYSRRFMSWEWLELSCVVIPANADASITAIKSADRLMMAASGHVSKDDVQNRPKAGVSATVKLSKGKTEMPKQTIAEQISAFENKRAASLAAAEAIQTKAMDDGRSKTAEEREEYKTHMAEVEAIDAELVDLRQMEKAQIEKAAKVDVDANNGRRVVDAQPSGIISVKSNLEKGIPFTRYVKSMAIAKGDPGRALMFAQAQKDWRETSPQVEMVLKAAVAAGDTTTAGWASELVYNQNLAAEFIEYLRPQTVIGRIAGLTRVPFNVRMGAQTGASSAYWVGQGAPIPVSKLTTSEVTLGIAKAAGMVVLDRELVRSSSPSAEVLVRNDLTNTCVEFLDGQFIDPNMGGVANVSPASITYGVTPVTPTGTTADHLRANIKTLFGNWITDNMSPAGAVWIMSETIALALSLMQNALGQPEFPTITMNGGTFQGLPVITSQKAYISGSPDYGNMIILLKAPDVLLADDGQVTVDASDQAAIQMLDNPTNTSTGATTATTMVSMWQTESVAIRATRFINWKKRRSNAVQFIRSANYA